jgi:long-chain acyl-CoA synthetase/crotonobetaine/carnitine-CoA ligase
MAALDAMRAAWDAKLAQASAEPLPASIPALLSAQAARFGERTLIELFEDGEGLSYRAFDELSSRLAARLRAQGIDRGSHVAVMLPNCIQFHPTWMALLKIGAVIVPVNPSYTAREVLHVLADSDACALFVAEERASVLDEFDHWPSMLRQDAVFKVAGGLRGGSDWHKLVDGEVTAACVAPPPLDLLANIQYTSGTTGFPKGCLLTQGYWLNLAQCAQTMHPAPLTRFFTAQPFFYMDPFWQLLQALYCGGTLFAAKKLSASKFFGWLAQLEIEWAQLPELALKYADTVAPDRVKLKQVFTFGWSAAARAKFTSRFDVPAHESFGMTEIGLGTAMPAGYPADIRPTSVGYAAIRRQVRIVDESGRECAAEQVGELQVRGEHLFQGYYKNPEANAKAFVNGDTTGWFRTGDAFRMDAEGFLFLVGRFKDMIRRSNENIAAREVEAVVRMLPQVLDCAAVAVPDAMRKEEVKILVQLQTGLAPDRLPVERLIAHCQANLAPFKVPRYYAYVEDFPRTSSNKVAKQVLLARGDPRVDSFDRVENVWHRRA